MLALLLLACAADPGPLDGPVRVQVDQAGISHIRATTDHDAFWAQGYACARDRMFQMDLLRRRAWGERAEVLGEARYDSDVQSRALRLGEWAQATEAALATEDPEFLAVVAAYTDGVNAFLADAEAGANGAGLSPQFAALGYHPEPWTVADTLAIEKLVAAGLSMRADQDVILGLLELILGAELFSDLYWFRAYDTEYVVPGFYDGLDTSAVQRVAARTGRTTPGTLPDLDLDPADVAETIRRLQALRIDMGGSNNQAVAGARTASGHALFASDSHQGLGHPAVYWLVHLSTVDAGGDLDVVGATFPGVPMVLFGHNGHVAWGPTTSIYDAADVWLETWADGSEQAVLFQGQAVPVERWTEQVRVRAEGGSVEAAEVRTIDLARVPHHGPMLPTDALGLPLDLPLSIRWNGYQARSIGRTFLELLRARDIDQAYAAYRHYYTGGMHFLFADADGRIGYDSTTDLPIREAVEADTPPVTLLPGEGGYEWVADPGHPGGFATVPRELIPHVLDPTDGILVSANNDPVGQTDDNSPFDAPVYVSGVFDIGTRAWQPRRMLEDFAAQGPVTLDQLVQVQLDTTTRLGQTLVPFVLEAAARRPDLVEGDVAAAVELLAQWDFRCEVDQVQPTLFHAWLAIFARTVLEDENSLVSSVMLEQLDGRLGLVLSKFVLRWLVETAEDIDAIEAGQLPFPSESGRNFFDDRDTPELETRDQVILESLAMAIEELRPVMGALGADEADLSTWTWGTVHVLHLEDPALAEASSAVLPKAGGLYTVDVGDHDWLVDGQLPDRYQVDNAPSNRFVFELDPDGFTTWMTLPGGQSEDPDSVFHNSLLPGFLAGEYEEIPLTEAAAEVEAVEVYTLRNDGGGVLRN